MLRAVLLVCAIAFYVPCASASALLVLHGPRADGEQLRAIRHIAAAYGVTLESREVTQRLMDVLPPASPVGGVVLSADLAGQWKRLAPGGLLAQVLNEAPILLFGAEARDELAPLRLADHPPGDCRYQVTDAPEDAMELASSEFACGRSRPHSTVIVGSAFRPIVSVESVRNGSIGAVFGRLSCDRQPVFVLTRQSLPPFDASTSLATMLGEAFGTSGPVALFIRAAWGRKTWHAPARLGNFTIDDPWLREPFGGLSYRQLLKSMKEHRFHTTIAFVPWNYDRSSPEVVSLFLENPEHLSIAIHGNNHDHEEFAPSRPLHDQAVDLRQALARMDDFQQRTTIPYDRAMVFPQQVAAPATLDLLRQYGFKCTVNLSNRRTAPAALPEIHPWSDFIATDQGAPSLKRELVGMPATRLATLAFLQVPILIHAHQDSLDLSRLEKVVDSTRRRIPSIRWSRLNEICDQLYLLRERSAGDWDVKLLGTSARLRNDSMLRRHFSVRRDVADAAPVAEVLVDGVPAPHAVEGRSLAFDVVLDPGAVSSVRVRFADERPSVVDEPIDKGNLKVRMLRYASDFRDIVLPESALGRSLHSLYYTTMRGRYDQIDHYLIVLVVGLGAAVVLYALAVIRRKAASR